LRRTSGILVGEEKHKLGRFQRFLTDEEGQDLVEYSLLIALLAVTSAAIFSHAGSSTGSVWDVARDVLSNGAVAAGS
jgi:Flp pilus assembly pilin Flp